MEPSLKDVLSGVVSVENVDGFPAETSPRQGEIIVTFGTGTKLPVWANYDDFVDAKQAIHRRDMTPEPGSTKPTVNPPQGRTCTFLPEKPTFMSIKSTDVSFLGKMINWLNSQKVEPESTVIRVHNDDPYEELDMRMAQVEGMQRRIHAAEAEVARLKGERPDDSGFQLGAINPPPQ